MNEIETFYGIIETTADALRVFELCRQGRLGSKIVSDAGVRRRLHESERKFIRSGSVFIFDEKESGIKRWTDGRIWSPSRILGNFLVYRELDRKASTLSINLPVQSPTSDPFLGEESVNRKRVKSLTPPKRERDELEEVNEDGTVSSSKGTYCFKNNGLVKKTISIKLDNRVHHLVCYYTKYDAVQGKQENEAMSTLMNELRKVVIPQDLINQQLNKKPLSGSTSSQVTSLAELTELELQLFEDIDVKWNQSASNFKPNEVKRRRSVSYEAKDFCKDIKPRNGVEFFAKPIELERSRLEVPFEPNESQLPTYALIPTLYQNERGETSVAYALVNPNTCIENEVKQEPDEFTWSHNEERIKEPFDFIPSTNDSSSHASSPIIDKKENEWCSLTVEELIRMN